MHTLVLMRELDKLGIEAFLWGRTLFCWRLLGRQNSLLKNAGFFPPVSHWTLLVHPARPLLFIFEWNLFGANEKAL